jgi:type IV pilus assembly protein PilE
MRCPARAMTGRRNGFTLIELLVVVAIVGTLLAVAVPAYRRHVERTHRVEAKTALLQLQQRQEQLYLRDNRYSNDLAALGFPGGCSEHCVYIIEFTVAPDASGYTARARPKPGGGPNGVDQTRDDECQWFSIDASLSRRAGPDPLQRCW